MTKETEKDRLKKEFKRLFKSMDFVCDNYLNKEGVPEKEQERFAEIAYDAGKEKPEWKERERWRGRRLKFLLRGYKSPFS